MTCVLLNLKTLARNALGAHPVDLGWLNWVSMPLGRSWAGAGAIFTN